MFKEKLNNQRLEKMHLLYDLKDIKNSRVEDDNNDDLFDMKFKRILETLIFKHMQKIERKNKIRCRRTSETRKIK